MVGNLTENPTNCAVAAQHVSRGDKARLELPPLAVAGPRETGEMPRHPCTFHRMRTENQMRAATEKPSPPPFRSVPSSPVPSVPRPYEPRRAGWLAGAAAAAARRHVKPWTSQAFQPRARAAGAADRAADRPFTLQYSHVRVLVALAF